MTRAGPRPGPADVRGAAARIAGRVLRTPLLDAPALPGVLLKAEHLQHSGSFKVRGATNAVLGQRPADLVTGSSGNHGIALATLGATLGTRVDVVMAAGASAAKSAVLRRLGARVVTVDGGVAERDEHARRLAEATGALLVPSSDDAWVVAGQGTVGLEVLEDAPDTDVIYVPTGGGGLLAGICLAVEGWHRPVRVIGVEPLACRRYARSLAAGRPVELPPCDTVADGLRGQRPGEVTLPVVRRRVDDMVGVSDEAITHAMGMLHRAGVAAEPSGSVALAGALRCGLTAHTVVVVSGGNTAVALAGRGEKVAHGEAAP